MKTKGKAKLNKKQRLALAMRDLQDAAEKRWANEIDEMSDAKFGIWLSERLFSRQQIPAAACHRFNKLAIKYKIND